MLHLSQAPDGRTFCFWKTIEGVLLLKKTVRAMIKNVFLCFLQVSSSSRKGSGECICQGCETAWWVHQNSIYIKRWKKGIKIYNVAVCFACSVHATWSVMMKNIVGFLAGFLALGEWQPYCKALEIYLQQIATHSILSKNKAVEIFLTSSEVSGHKQTCSSLCFKSSFFMISPSKKNFILQKRARF